ncbi:MAG: hypothetical protein CMJ70_04920 [Planctomycetaceae bacterium]|nr:hypothetical protein [Planctomycetaceae bacterium]
MGQQYFIKRGERVRGPFTAKQIKSGIRSEKIKQEDLVGRSEAGPWKEVRSVLPQEKSTGSPPGASDVTVVEVAPEVAPVVPDSSLVDPPAETPQPADSPVSSASADGNLPLNGLASADSAAAGATVPGTSTATSGQAGDALDSASPDLAAAAEHTAENTEENRVQSDLTIHEQDPDATLVIPSETSREGDVLENASDDAHSTTRDLDAADPDVTLAPDATLAPDVTLQQPQTALVEKFAKTLGPGQQDLYRTLPEVSLKPQLDEKGDVAKQPAAVSAAVTVRPRTIQSAGKTLVDERPSSADAQEPAAGNLDYVTLSKLGQGGMGTVHLARQVALGREVAVKQIHLQPTEKQSFRDEFLTEAVLTGKLEHPNIIPIHEVGELPDGDLFYSMKNVKGRSWDETIDTFSLTENLEILIDVCDAIAFAHAEGVIHRDLKPENIMTASFGEVLVLDWGLAVLTEPGSDVTTGAGGTPSFMAPEMISPPCLVGPRTDVYLLGAILFRLLTGQPPHRGESAATCLMAVVKNEIVTPDPEQVKQRDPTGELLEIALKAMATDPLDRYQTVGAFQQAVRDFEAHRESLTLAARAEQALETAEQHADYTKYSEAVFGFSQAVELWDGNEFAQTAAGRARLAYALCAEGKEDFELGLSLLDATVPEQGEVIGRLTAARQERDTRLNRLKWMKQGLAVAAILLFLVVGGAAVWINNERLEANRQRQLASENAEESQRNQQIAEENARLAQRNAYYSDMLLVQRNWEAANTGNLRALLNKYAQRDDLKGVEWDYWERMNGSDVLSLTGHTGDLWDVAFSPDGQRLASASWDKTVKLWDAGTGEEILTLAGHKNEVVTLAFSPDGTRLAAADSSGVVMAWDVSSQVDHAVNLERWAGNLAAGEHSWSVLEPTSMESSGGSTFTHLDDHSLLVGGVDPHQDVYDICARTDKLGMTAVRLEALNDPSLPGGGPGRGKNSNFHLSEFELTVVSQQNPEQSQVVKFQRAQAQRSQPAQGGWPAFGIDQAIDGKTEDNNSWAVMGMRDQSPVTAIFVASVPFGYEGGSELRFRLRHETEWTQNQAVGRLRLSVTSTRRKSHGPAGLGHTLGYEGAPAELVRIASLAASDRTQQEQQQLASFYQQHYSEGDLWRELFTLPNHTGALHMEVAFSPDSTRLACVGGYEFRVWDVNTGRRLLEIPTDGNGLVSVAYSADGRHLAGGGWDKYIKIWDATTGEEKRTLPGHSSVVMAVQFSPDGKRLASGGRDNMLKLWDVTTGEETWARTGHAEQIHGVAFSPDGRLLATGSMDNVTKIWDVATGEERLSMRGHLVSDLAFSPDGQRLATAGAQDKSVKIWDLAIEREKNVITLQGHDGDVNAAEFSPDGRLVASAGADKTIRLWDTAMGQEKFVLEGHTSPVLHLAFSPDGKRLVSASGKQVAILSSPEGKKYLAPDVPDGAATLKVWDVATGEELFEMSDPPRPAGFYTSVAFFPSGNEVASVSRDGRYRLWDLTKRAPWTGFYVHQGQGTTVAIYPGGRWMVTGGMDGQVAIHDTLPAFQQRRPPQPIRVRLSFTVVNQVAVSPDGTRLAAAYNGGLYVLDGITGNKLLTLKGHRGRQTASVAFSPDGQRLASGGGDDKTIKVWDTTTGRETLTLRGHMDYVSYVAFSADGKRLVSASDDGTVKIWDARPWTSELLAQAQARSVLKSYRQQVESLENLRAQLRDAKHLSDLARERALEWSELFWINREEQ